MCNISRAREILSTIQFINWLDEEIAICDSCAVITVVAFIGYLITTRTTVRRKEIICLLKIFFFTTKFIKNLLWFKAGCVEFY